MQGIVHKAAMMSLMGAFAMATPAMAASVIVSGDVSYTADYAEGAPVTASNSANSTPFAMATLSKDYGYGYGASHENGILGAQAVAGSNSGGSAPAAMAMMAMPLVVVDPGDPGGANPLQVTTIGNALWETTITNYTGSALDYSFTFHVYGPTLQTASDSGEANVWFSITSDTHTDPLLSASASLSGSDWSFDPIFGTPSYDSSSNAYNFADFNASVSLGTIGAGESFTLTYNMGAYAFATDMDNYSYAYIGDPIGFSDGPSYSMRALPTGGGEVPEPASWLMMITGFAFIGGMARKRRRQARYAC